MLRGAVILWNTLFGVLFLGKKLNRLHYGGLLLAVTGIVIVGAASLLAEHAKSGGGGALAPPTASFFPPPPPSLAPVPAPSPAATPTQQHAGFSLRAALSPQARAAALRSGDPDAASARWVVVGMGMIVVSQLIQAAGMTMEEFVLRKYELSSTQLVGYEGGVGVLLMAGIFLPVRRARAFTAACVCCGTLSCASHASSPPRRAAHLPQIIAHLPGKDVGGVYENSMDTAYMIFHSPLIGGLLAVDLLAINLFNAAGMRITSSLGAVFRSVLEAVRTLNVWLLDLALFYYFTNGTLGEAWSGQYSWLQACGFVVLVSSALTYGRGNMRAAAAAAAAAAVVAAAEAPAAAEAGDAPAPAPQLGVRTFSGGQPNLPPVRAPCVRYASCAL
jgi:hypothetical protein